MRVPGPYSDDTWQWLADNGRTTQPAAPEANRFPRVIWDIGVLLAVPLASAAIVGLFLKTAGIY